MREERQVERKGVGGKVCVPAGDENGGGVPTIRVRGGEITFYAAARRSA